MHQSEKENGGIHRVVPKQLLSRKQYKKKVGLKKKNATKPIRRK